MASDPNIYDVGESISLYARFLSGATVGTILPNQTLLQVRDPELLDLSGGATLVLVGAGAVGGDLITTVVSADGQNVTIADPAPQRATLVVVGNPATPTVACTVQLPGGTTASPTVGAVGTAGRYKAVYTPSTDGEFFYRFTASGAFVADGWRKFVVRPERVG